MVEVFKTNVETVDQAARLVQLIQEYFPEYTVNFDLEDCDRILRVKSLAAIIEKPLIEMLNQNGFDAALLTDEIPPFIDRKITLSTS